MLTAYPPSRGGVQLHTRELARAQTERGDEVHVATMWRHERKDWLRGTTVAAPAPAGSTLEPDGVTVHGHGLTPAARWRAAVPAASYYGAMRRAAGALTRAHRPGVERIVDEVAPDVVHLSRIGREGFYQAVVDVCAARRIPWVLTPTHHPSWTRRRDWWWLQLYRGAGALLALSDHEREALVSCGAARERIVRTVVAPVGLEPGPLDDLPDEPRVVYLGQVREYTGIRLVVEAVEQLRAEGIAIQLDVVGPWVDRLPKLRRALEGAAHVTVHGAVSDEAKRRLLSAGRVLCLPSTEESLGGVYLEAWSVGRPAVGADIPAVRELFERTGGGLAVTPSASGVADGLRRVLTDDDLARDLAARGHRAVRGEYRWSVAAARAAEAYDIAREANLRVGP